MGQKNLVQELRDIRNLSYDRFRGKKMKNESDSDYIKRISGNRCTYCKRKFSSDKLSIVRKFPDRKSSKLKNGVCACKDCANEKGSMNDYQYRSFIERKKKETRKEILEVYPQIRETVFEKYNYTCIYCVYEYGKSIEGRKLTIDHKVPVSKGGTNDLKNLCCACEEHNFEKKDLTAEEYFKELEFRKKGLTI